MNYLIGQQHYKTVSTLKGILAIKSRFYGFEKEIERKGKRTQSFLVKDFEVDLGES